MAHDIWDGVSRGREGCRHVTYGVEGEGRGRV